MIPFPIPFARGSGLSRVFPVPFVQSSGMSCVFPVPFVQGSGGRFFACWLVFCCFGRLRT